VQLLPPMVVIEIPWLGKGNFPLAISLCHYPIGEWDRKHHGAWHLHGHSHGRYVHQDDGLILDVGVDTQGFAPVSLDGVAAQMAAKGWKL
jgi:calcineurin-like phosphoesterase family protein